VKKKKNGKKKPKKGAKNRKKGKKEAGMRWSSCSVTVSLTGALEAVVGCSGLGEAEVDALLGGVEVLVP